jgi:hypothetical protein
MADYSRRQMPRDPKGLENDWGAVINMQAEANKKREAEEQRLRKLNAQMLKEEYERQIREKQLAKQQEEEHRRQEQELYVKKGEALRAYENQLRQDQRAINSHFQNEYDLHTDFKSRQKAAEREEWLRTEQERLDRLKEDMVREEAFKRQWKDAVVREEQTVLDRQGQVRASERLGHQMEKVREQERISFNVQRSDERDQRLKDLYGGIKTRMDERERAYRPAQDAHQERNMRLQLWMSDNERKLKQRLAQKERLERDLKEAAQRGVNETLEKQMQEKDLRKRATMEEYQQEKETVSQKITMNRRLEEELQELRRREVQDYKSKLEQQVELKKQEQLDVKRMSPRERELNQSLIKKYQENQVAEFAGVPGVHPRDVPLEKVLPRAFKHHGSSTDLPMASSPQPTRAAFSRVGEGSDYERNARVFYGDDQRGRSSTEGNPSKAAAFELAYDPSRHNPIINPIGDYVPRPLNGKGLGKGRGINQLLNAGKGVVNPAAY